MEGSYLIENDAEVDGGLCEVNASEQFLLNVTPNSDCQLGHIANALDVLVLHGTASRTTTPYLGSKLFAPSPQPIEYRLVTWGPISVDPRQVAPTDDIKRALCAYGPVTSRIIVTRAFEKLTGSDTYRENGHVGSADEVGHHINIIGWDDRRGRDGAWLIKNSWVSGWGMVDGSRPGFAWVEYGANKIGHYAHWVVAFHRNVLPEDLGAPYNDLKNQYFQRA